MRIARVRIKNYRSIKDLTLEVDDYTALVGPNGSGKSSVLYALDWFFNGGGLSSADVHSTSHDGAGEGLTEAEEISVQVTFAELNAEDRNVLRMYGHGEAAVLRRVWSAASGEKLIGNSRQGPGFAEIRGASPITAMRDLYRTARETFPGLEQVTAKEAILGQLEEWEADPANGCLLEEVEAADASHMFGFNGGNVLAQRIQLVLVPASSNIDDHVAASGKTSAVARLVGALISQAASDVRQRWESDNAEELERLSREMTECVQRATRLQEERVNEHLVSLVPEASVEFVSDPPTWALRGDPTIRTAVRLNGDQRDVGRQGHGVQRAVMISLLQALAPDRLLAESNVTGEDPEEREVALQEEFAALPAIIVCIEEPEIYQHPVRARHFARVLERWATRADSQVLLATHSPYFVLPEQFSSLRRCVLDRGRTSVRSTSAEAVAGAAGVDAARVRNLVQKELPRTFSEAFFADRVVFVEGDTDRAVLEVLAERLGRSFDSSGIALLPMGGKDNLKIPHALLGDLGIPAYVIADGDADGGQRKHPENEAKRREVEGSHRAATQRLLNWLPQDVAVHLGELPCAWGAPTTVTEQWCLHRDDLESELADWAEWCADLAALGYELRSKDAAVMRSVTLDATLDGIPQTFRVLIEAIHAFG